MGYHSHEDMVEHWGNDGRGPETTIVPSLCDQDDDELSFMGRYLQMLALVDGLSAVLVPGRTVTAAEGEMATRLRALIVDQQLDFDGKL